MDTSAVVAIVAVAVGVAVPLVKWVHSVSSRTNKNSDMFNNLNNKVETMDGSIKMKFSELKSDFKSDNKEQWEKLDKINDGISAINSNISGLSDKFVRRTECGHCKE